MPITKPTIEEVKAIQAERGLTHTHVVWIGPTGFVIAHTEYERSVANLGVRPLTACTLHRWLMAQGGPTGETGYYTVLPYTPDAYSEDFGRLPYTFTHLIDG